ncbi:MAG: toll/interleukin-1 receptor domain-containing protein [Alphaproteobacteria bacterium]
MAVVFFSYSHKDESLRDQLETHLAMLKRQKVISTWHDRRLVAGDDVNTGISKELDHSDIILLLVSPNFLASEYCYGVEMAHALKLHAEGKARVIPVILRPCDWAHAPFGRLLATPKDGKPVTKWADADDAFLDIATAIRSAATGQLNISDRSAPPPSPARISAPPPAGPRSSNLRMLKTFTERDRDLFVDEAFEFMARFFENSLRELEARNPGVEGSFKRVDASKFTASIYRNGAAVARCQIRSGGLARGITLSYGNSFSDNAFNENLSVETGEQVLHLRPMGMQMHRGVSGGTRLGLEGAAEYYWDLFIEPLQQ